MKKSVRLALAIAASSLALEARAQSTSAAATQPEPSQVPAESADGDVQPSDEIVVYGLKGARAQSLRTAPVAVSAVNAVSIQEQHLTSLTDVSRLMPNTQLNTSGTFSTFPAFGIRGVGVFLTTPTVDPAVSISVDGMSYAFPPGTNIDTFDIDSLEVYRGPQGALQGRNATGGVVAIRTRRPTNNFEAEGLLTLGNYSRFDIGGFVAGPLVEDKILAKLAVVRRSRDSYFTRGGTFRAAPLNPTGVNPTSLAKRGEDSLLIRPTLVFKPTEDWTISLLGEYSEIDNRGPTGRIVTPAGVTPPTIGTLYGYEQNPGNFVSNEDLPTYSRIHNYRGIIETVYDVENLGVFTSITGYRKVRYDAQADIDSTPFVIIQFPDNKLRSKQFSQELRYASTFSKTFDLIIGGYYSSSDLYVLERRQYPGTLVNRPVDQYVYNQGGIDQEQKTAAAFVNLTWHIDSRLNFSAGARYTWERKVATVSPATNCPGSTGFGACVPNPVNGRKSWDDFSPRLVLSYQPTPEIFLYASYTKGFRSGSFDSRATNPLAIGPAEPETVTSKEVGVKASMFDRVLETNIAVFSAKYDDIQRNVRVGNAGFSILTNAAKATIAGVEAELRLKPMSGLELSGTFGYTDASYDEFQSLPAGSPPLDKLRFAAVPKYTAAGDISYTFRVPKLDMMLKPSASYSYRSSQFLDTLNFTGAYLKGYGVLTLSMTASLDRWSLTAYGRNVTSAKWYDYASAYLSKAAPYAYMRYGGEPATYGLELSYRF